MTHKASYFRESCCLLPQTSRPALGTFRQIHRTCDFDENNASRGRSSFPSGLHDIGTGRNIGVSVPLLQLMLSIDLYRGNLELNCF